MSEIAKNSIAHKYLNNIRLVILGYIVVIIAGVLALMNLPREMMPSINLPMAVVSVVLPGASPADVEELITIPLEDSLRGIKEIDKISSSSMENSSLIILQFTAGTKKEEVIREVQQKVDATRLPTEAMKPMVSKIDFTETPVWTFALEGSDKVGLNLVAKKVQEALEKQATLDRVEVTGLSEREIGVFISSEKLREFNLHPVLLNQIIAAASNNSPAGVLELGKLSYNVSLDKTLIDIKSLRELPLMINGQNYLLGEIAEIYEQEKPDVKNSFQLNDKGEIKEVVTLNVYKVAGTPIDANAKLAKKVTQEVLQDYPQFSSRNLIDYGAEITKTFVDLGVNIAATFILVFLVMLIFLGVREALISSISIPLVMLMTFAGMTFFGLSLNFISLFALLLVLGMLVDNAIVVTTALSREFQEHGLSPLEAGVKVWQEYFMALIATNLTTVWAFLPLILMTGMMGEFLKPISIVVTMAILGSALVAFLLTLPLGVFVLKWQLPTRVAKLLKIIGISGVSLLIIGILPKSWLLLVILPMFWLSLYLGQKIITQIWSSKQKKSVKKQQWREKLMSGWIKTNKIEAFYQRLLTSILQNKKKRKQLLVAIAIVTVAAFCLPAMGLVKSEFFPKEAADLLMVELTLPVGTNQTKAREILLEFLPQFQNLPSVDYVTGEAGRGNSSTMLSGGSSNEKILFTVNLKDKKDRTLDSIELAQLLREKWQENDYGEIVVIEASSGPPAGADLELSLAGDDLEILAQKAQELELWLKQQDGVTDVSSSLGQASKKLVFVPNQKLLNEYNLKSTDLSAWLRSSLSGWNLGKMKIDGEELNITLRQQKGIPQIETLENLQVPTSVGYVPLNSLGQFQTQANNSVVARKDYQRLVTVKATVTTGFSTAELGKQLNDYANNQLQLPAGYEAMVGGVNEQNAESMDGIQLAMIVATVAILMTLVIQLQSFRKALIVMSVIPVAVSGVFFNFGLFGIALSLPAFIGILALFGIVVNNSILIVEKINQNLSQGQEFIQAVVEGSKSRLQPILLTSLTTIVGLLPITFSDPMWQGLGGAIIAGLTFSGVLLLLYIPVLYTILFKNR